MFSPLQVINGHHPIWQAAETWEDNCSELESSLTVDLYGQNAALTKLNGTYNEGVMGENSISDDSPSQLEDTGATNREDDTDEYCKDVRCLEMIESAVENFDSGVNGDVASQNSVSAELDETGEGIHSGNLPKSGAQEQRLNDAQRTINSLATSQDELSSAMGADHISSFRNFILSSCRSCRDDALNGSSSLGFEETENSESTPVEFQKDSSGRPEGFLPLNYSEGIPRLARNDSQSSIGTLSMVPSTGPNGDEDITSVQTFVAGMKEMANAYEKQLAEVGIFYLVKGLLFSIFLCLMGDCFMALPL